MDEDRFKSLVVITVKSDTSAKVTLDSRTRMIATKTPYGKYGEIIKSDRNVQLFISKIDLDYAYGQMKLSETTSLQCV